MIAVALVAAWAGDPAARADRFTLLSGAFGFAGSMVGYLAVRWGDHLARTGLLLAAGAFAALMLSVAG